MIQVALRLIMDLDEMVSLTSCDNLVLNRIVTIVYGYAWTKKLLREWSSVMKKSFLTENLWQLDQKKIPVDSHISL